MFFLKNYRHLAMTIVCALFATNTAHASLSPAPPKLTQCVLETASKVQNATSAADLERRLEGKIHRTAFGMHAFKRGWINSDEVQKNANISHYFTTLYNTALKKSRGHEGYQKTITVMGIEGQMKIYTAEDYSEFQMAYHVVVHVATSNMSRPEVIIVLMLPDCKFVDISVVVGTSQKWWSKHVSSLPR